MSNWKTEAISEFGEVISGGTPATNIAEYWGGNVVWVTPADLSKIHFAPLWTSEKKISTIGLSNSSANLIPKKSIVISSRAPIGYIAVPEVDFSTNQGCKSVKLKPGHDPIFHYFNFKQHIEVFKRRGEGTTFAEISKKEIEKLQFSYPPLPHQRKIARILTTVDNIIEKTEAAIAKYKAIKQGMMHDLFTRGIDVKTGKLRPKFEDAPELYKESELGWIPKEWEVKRLDELSKQIGDGIHATPKYSVNTGLYFINGNNLDDGKISIFESTLCVDKDEYKRHYLALDENTLLYSINGTIGNIAIYRGEKVILGKSAAYIICRNKKLLKYLYHYLQTIFVDSFYENEMTGSTIKNLSLTSIRKTPIRIPKNENEQNFISEKITSLASKIEYELEFLDKYQKIKSGLMQDLLTGKKEVTPDPEDYKEMEI